MLATLMSLPSKTKIKMLTNEDYHADREHISKSGLDLIDRSPLHFWNAYMNPATPPRLETPTFKMGTATHTMFLEHDNLDNDYFVLDNDDILREIGGSRPHSTSRYKNWYQGVLSEHPDKKPLSLTEYECLRGMRDSLYSYRTASKLLEGGIAEQTITFIEPITGVKCKVRPDFLSDYNVIVDVKTTDDASYEGFRKSMAKYRYYVQDAFYLDGVNHSDFNFSPSMFVFIAIEKEPPYAVGVYTLENIDREFGREQYLQNLWSYKEAKETGIWKSYPDRIQNMSLPAWVAKSKIQTF
jgi:hypothetical protein